MNVRFILVDRPETVNSKKGVEPFGHESSDFIKNTLSSQIVELRIGVQERDEYSRLLAYALYLVSCFFVPSVAFLLELFNVYYCLVR
ncbi:hypothetical protein XJ18_13240 [Bacillus pumilus]|nr:hypothetical protein XJ18_13240 [Bacillus pumilus]